MAAAQTIAVVEAGGRTVSLGSVLGPSFAEDQDLFSADEFHPSAAGYAAAAAVREARDSGRPLAEVVATRADVDTAAVLAAGGPDVGEAGAQAQAVLAQQEVDRTLPLISNRIAPMAQLDARRAALAEAVALHPLPEPEPT